MSCRRGCARCRRRRQARIELAIGWTIAAALASVGLAGWSWLFGWWSL